MVEKFSGDLVEWAWGNAFRVPQSVVFTQHPAHRDALIVNRGNGHGSAGIVFVARRVVILQCVKSGQTREALDETHVVTVDAQSLHQVVHALALSTSTNQWLRDTPAKPTSRDISSSDWQ
jgi:hypothetical protein